MEYDQELLERRKMLKGEIETLERKLKDTKEELLQVEGRICEVINEQSDT